VTLSSVVIVGAGAGGAQVAASLRLGGFEGSISLVHGEPGLPYHRPPLSKAYLLGRLEARKLLLRQEHWYAKQQVDLVLDRVVAVDRAEHQVRLTGGRVLPYDHLVLATGSRKRELPVPGTHLEGVIGMRTREDADELASRVRSGVQVVVAGAGFIGLEFAAVAAAHGASVHVLEMGDRPMARAVSGATADFIRRAHEGWGVRFDFGQALTAIDGEGHVTGVETGDGRRLPAELVVYGIGVVPETVLAEEAGLAIENGIRVDDRLLTSDPDISAIGDAASFPSAHTGGRIRLESVQNAVDQARHVAARLMGASVGYDALPWFWSDQGDLKIQIAGLADPGDDAVALALPDPRATCILRFRGDRLVAVETVNRPGDHILARRILATDRSPSPAEAAIPGFDLTTWHESHGLAATG
jgi:NADPH-dependent 2,4-dienoyl-CoA reductase/sulfur reductase-like enzyme